MLIFYYVSVLKFYPRTSGNPISFPSSFSLPLPLKRDQERTGTQIEGRLFVCCLLKGAHTRSKIPSIYWSKKLTSKFWLDFYRVWEIFFVKKYIDSKYWRIKSVWYILTSSQYFDNSSIFWRVCELLSKFWSKIQSSSEHLAKTIATATATSGSNIFKTMNFDQNFDGTCVGNMASKILSKFGRPFFASKYWLFFSIVYGALNWQQHRRCWYR